MEIDKSAVEAAIVEKATEQIVEAFFNDRIGSLQERVQASMETVVVKHCDDVVGPILEKGVQDFVIQRTNRFGETKGADITFTEYITSLAKEWLQRSVDYQGNPVERESYRNEKAQSRLTHLLNEHLHRRIGTAMKDAVATVVKSIAPAIATTCELKVKEATADIRRAMGK